MLFHRHAGQPHAATAGRQLLMLSRRNVPRSPGSKKLSTDPDQAIRNLLGHLARKIMSRTVAAPPGDRCLR
jgi:hypothetical protein